MNRFGYTQQALNQTTARALDEIGARGTTRIDTALELMDQGVDPRDIAHTEYHARPPL